ncbi:MAG: universal stress protein [Pseudomonadota bacterium]
MVRNIMLPIDLANTDALTKSLDIAVQIAGASDAKITMVGVTSSAPTQTAGSPKEFKDKLETFGREFGDAHSLQIDTLALTSVDVPTELGGRLLHAADDLSADLIVMASHVPGFIEHIFASNAGYIASHAKCSVYVVR